MIRSAAVGLKPSSLVTPPVTVEASLGASYSVRCTCRRASATGLWALDPEPWTLGPEKHAVLVCLGHAVSKLQPRDWSYAWALMSKPQSLSASFTDGCYIH